MQLWTEKHKPKSAGGMVGQSKAISEAIGLIHDWRPGKALLFHGPPGVGKTLLAEIIAAERDAVLVQVNASDSRSGKELERLLAQSVKQQTLFRHGKIILIDEVDGITGRERGAAGILAKVIRESRFPIILSANDPWLPKLRPLRQHVHMVKFNRIPYPSIAKRLREIAKSEGVHADESVLRDLARFASGDIRSAMLDLQLLATGKDAITERDLESLGFRERERSVIDILPTLLFSGSLRAARKVIREADKDPDEIFWWIESNLPLAYKGPGPLADAYDLLSKADLCRSRVARQQNWRFKAYMVDLMSGISRFRDEQDQHGFVPFKPPYRLLRLGQTRMRRALLKSLSLKLGQHLHCSSSVIKREYLPALRLLLKHGQHMPEEIGLTPEEIDIIKSG